MTTRPYTELVAQIAALFGADLATQESARVKIFVKRRAQRAYAESETWPRFLKIGEERVVSETGLLPYEQDGLDTIGTIYRVHSTLPFVSQGALEYVDYVATADGIQITGYNPAASASIQVTTGTTDAATPDPSGIYSLSSTTGEGQAAVWVLNGNENALTYPYGVISYGDDWELRYSLDQNTIGEWDAQGTAADPTLGADWTASIGSGIPIFAFPYSVFVTYKAALPTTYGTGDGEESDFPDEWFEYTAQGAYADLLRSDGNHDQAMVAELEAERILDQQLMKLSRQAGSHVNTRIVTHSNMQAR